MRRELDKVELICSVSTADGCSPLPVEALEFVPEALVLGVTQIARGEFDGYASPPGTDHHFSDMGHGLFVNNDRLHTNQGVWDGRRVLDAEMNGAPHTGKPEFAVGRQAP